MYYEFIKKQILLCLNCRIGVEILRNYTEIYDMENCIEENAQGIIVDNSALLEINGDIEYKYRILKQLGSSTKFEEDADMCLVNLQRIITALIPFYDFKLNKNTFTELRKNRIEILSEMHRINECSKNKYDNTYGENALKLIKRTKSRDSHSNEIEKGFSYIFNHFCCTDKSNYIINHKNQCFGILFIEAVNEDLIEKKDKEDFFLEVSKLGDDSKCILLDYLQNAPKQFGYCLELVMKRQEMSEQDIAKLLGKRPSYIQWLIKCNVPNLEKSEIEYLCRVLLVSADVLLKGVGKIYGNWKSLLTRDALKEIQTETNRSRINETKSYVRENITKIIKMNQKEFEITLNDMEPFFRQEDFSLSKEECFDGLLNEDEVNTLLEVLKKRENRNL